MKTTLRNKVASALSFAHLAGFAGRAKADSDEDPDKKDPEAEDEDPDHQDQDRQDGGARKARRASDDEPDKKDPDAEDDDPDEKGPEAEDEDLDEDEPKKAGRRAEADDDEDEMRGKSAAANARRRERARCAAIFGSKAAGRNPVLAANLAFNTSMTRKEAIAVLEGSPAAAASAYGSRSARNPVLGGGGDAQLSSKQAAVSRMDAAMKRVRGQ